MAVQDFNEAVGKSVLSVFFFLSFFFCVNSHDCRKLGLVCVFGLNLWICFLSAACSRELIMIIVMCVCLSFE
jgi:hypothetical protein